MKLELDTVAVVGGVNIDIGGRPHKALVERDSNPGRIGASVGGVGRNIAHDLCLMGTPTVLLTAYGNDRYAEMIEGSCAAAGIDLSRARRVPGAYSPCYLFITDERGDMRLAVSDMEVCREISPAYLAENRAFLDGAGAVVLDANVPEESIRWLAENCAAPLFADPVSVAKAIRLRSVLHRLHTLKPNRQEAELLSGVSTHTPAGVRAAAEKLCAMGVREVFISLGEEGVLACAGGESVLVPAFPAQVKNTTGAGDALMAALVRGYLDGGELADRARFACAAASICTESSRAVNPRLSKEAIIKRMNTGE